jgi:hypothetical protein
MRIVQAIRALIREARANRVMPGKGIAVARTPTGTIITRLEDAPGGGGGGQSEYNGYFTLKLVQEGSNTRIYVCDGATWNEEERSSGPSLLHLNQRNFWIERGWAPVTKSQYVVVCWEDAVEEDDEADPPMALAEMRSYTTLMDSVPDDSYSAIYRIIGRVFVNGDEVTIQQDHTSGVLYATVFTECSTLDIEQDDD